MTVSFFQLFPKCPDVQSYDFFLLLGSVFVGVLERTSLRLQGLDPPRCTALPAFLALLITALLIDFLIARLIALEGGCSFVYFCTLHYFSQFNLQFGHAPVLSELLKYG